MKLSIDIIPLEATYLNFLNLYYQTSKMKVIPVQLNAES
jgi:hypothetical protein